MPHSVRWVLYGLAAVTMFVSSLDAQRIVSHGAVPRPPTATLVRTTDLTLPGSIDSNSPVIWEVIEGRRAVVVLTSAGFPRRSVGSSLRTLSRPTPISISPLPDEGVWMEAIIRDEKGTWYGFYHNERLAVACGDTTRVSPRIGAARSDDFGVTWTDLGILIEAPPSTFACDTSNKYFVGGVGDLVAMLDHDAKYVYVYFSQYGAEPSRQGVGVARFLWADRNAPVGRTDIWSDGVWLPGRLMSDAEAPQLVSGLDDTGTQWEMPAATSVFPTYDGWHGPDAVVDAYWGPSIHWNAHVQQYVMLLNRAENETFAQKGVYISFNTAIDDPAGWSTPTLLLKTGSWYPQVIGAEPDGTDKWGGQDVRLFVGGQSRYRIHFER